MPNIPTNNPITDNIASGFDRNDGTLGKGGNVTPAANIIVTAAGGVTDIKNIQINELPDSPTIERAEQGTIVHNYRMPYVTAMQRIMVYGRGALVTDSGGNFYRVLSSSIQYQKGAWALMTVTCESITFDAPPDEFSCTPVKLGLDIMKHPRYFYALMPTNQLLDYNGPPDNDDQIMAKQAIIRAIQAYRENPFVPTDSNIAAIVGALHDNITATMVDGHVPVAVSNPNFNNNAPVTGPDPVGGPASANPRTVWTWKQGGGADDQNNKIAFAQAAAMEIIGKLWRMEDSPLINGLEISWSEYYFRPPLLNLGGYIEDPILNANPGLPDYFYSTASPPNGNQTIFDNIAQFNPQAYSSDGTSGGSTKISWLRDADTLEFQRTWFKVTRKWLGAPVGAWDPDIYQTGSRPSLGTYGFAAPIGYRDLISHT